MLRDCVIFELFARSKEPFLREFLMLEGGHSAITLSRGCSDCLIRRRSLLPYPLSARSAEAAEEGPVALDAKGQRCALAKVRTLNFSSETDLSQDPFLYLSERNQLGPFC